MLATDTTHRGQGVARTLVQWGLNCAAAERIEAGLETGPTALPFYMKMGFNEVHTAPVAEIDAGEGGVQNKIYCMLWSPPETGSG